MVRLLKTTRKGVQKPDNVIVPNPTKNDIIIPIIGTSGVGKSTFINVAVGKEVATVGHGLQSCTTAIEHIVCPYPNDPSRRVIFIDTPGFDSTYADGDDLNTLKRIGFWLARSYSTDTKLAGIIYMHDITQSRVLKKPRPENFDKYDELCGDDGAQRVVLATTKWCDIAEDAANQHQTQLSMKFWKDMLDRGSCMAQFRRTPESAWDIINHIVGIGSLHGSRIQTGTGKKSEVQTLLGLNIPKATQTTSFDGWQASTTADNSDSTTSQSRMSPDEPSVTVTDNIANAFIFGEVPDHAVKASARGVSQDSSEGSEGDQKYTPETSGSEPVFTDNKTATPPHLFTVHVPGVISGDKEKAVKCLGRVNGRITTPQLLQTDKPSTDSHTDKARRLAMITDHVGEEKEVVADPPSDAAASSISHEHDDQRQVVRSEAGITEGPRSRNVVIFGETGAGKSSLVNMIVGSRVAATSQQAAPCTLDAQDYEAYIDGQQYRIYDTVCLNEPKKLEQKKHNLAAIEKAYRLIASLVDVGGVHLLIFCFRAGRFTEDSRRAYLLFSEFICESQVPVVIVITHLEKTVPMEDWWADNQHQFDFCDVPAVAHACVTTLDGDELHQQKYNESRKHVCELLQQHAAGKPFTKERFAWAATITEKLGELIGVNHVLPLPHLTKAMVQYLTEKGLMGKEHADALAKRIIKI
ncbi:hypothetical protein BV22DRAFT_1068031 [Leucogyrophana mollusca]|uniref:Uncharacterized protein n=1 Tax=Leucogyrophana mollusca TaxID=85980 RepID=A0ACB8BET9_9AGAM|nr:hypothetical protein BV22DRAFT_1068031 [Leucogyrophana mollusca]